MASRLPPRRRPLSVVSGDDTGLLKHVTLASTPVLASRFGEQAFGGGVGCLSWGPQGEGMVGAGLDSGAVRFWRMDGGDAAAAHVEYAADDGWGGSCGVVAIRASEGPSSRVSVCDREGRVRLWGWQDDAAGSSDHGEVARFETAQATAAAQFAADGERVLMGGRGADATVWSLATGQSLYKARNVPHDELDLLVPVWLSAVCWMPDRPQAFVTGHGFVEQRLRGEVRLYDAAAARRPQLRSIAPLGEEAVTSVAVSSDGLSVYAGSVTGCLVRLDMRKGLKPLERYKGCAGSVRKIDVHPTLPLVACAGADRMMRVYNTRTGDVHSACT